MILLLSCSQYAEGASVSCEPYDSAAVAVSAQPTRGAYVRTSYSAVILLIY